jgi:hypothetical protein
VSADGLLERCLDAVTCVFVAGVGEGGQIQLGRGPVQRAGDSGVAGHGEVVEMAGRDVRHPDRLAVGAHNGLDVPAGSAVFPRVPRVDRLALHAFGLGAAVGAEQLAVEHHVRPTLLGHLLQYLVQIGYSFG